MTWQQRYQWRQFVKNSLWLGPVLAMVAAIVSAHLLRALDRRVPVAWPDLSVDSARTLLGVLLASELTFIIFLFSSLLVVVQLASVQLTPRIISRALSDRGLQVALMVMVFFFTLSLSMIANVNDRVPQISMGVCAYGSLLCIAMFLYAIDRVGRLIRPLTVLTGVAQEERQLIESFYPKLLTEPGERHADPSLIANLPEPAMIPYTGSSGVLQAFDDEGLLELAQRHNCVIELIPQVGDFLATGAPLFYVYGANRSISPNELFQSLAVGPERTMEQDPLFGFRIIVDIASKALSPAINDPTTAVMSLDQIHHLLRLIGSRHLDTGHIFDRSGNLRLMYRTPDWPDFVRIAVTEIRHFGHESIQIVRRLSALLDELSRTLPEDRAQLLRDELRWVQSDAAQFFVTPKDKTLASTGDSQGLGGVPEVGTTNEIVPEEVSEERLS